MTLVMLIVGIIIGIIICIGLISLGLMLMMLFDKESRHEMVDYWDMIDDKHSL